MRGFELLFLQIAAVKLRIAAHARAHERDVLQVRKQTVRDELAAVESDIARLEEANRVAVRCHVNVQCSGGGDDARSSRACDGEEDLAFTARQNASRD